MATIPFRYLSDFEREQQRDQLRRNPERCPQCLCCLTPRRCPHPQCSCAETRRRTHSTANQPIASVIQLPARSAARAPDDPGSTRLRTVRALPVPAATPEQDTTSYLSRPFAPGGPAEPVLPAQHAAPEIVQAHLRHMELSGKRPNTISARAKSLARLQRWLAPTPLAEATPEDLYRWRVAISGLSDQTVLKYIGDARGFYAWMAENGLRDDDPARRIPVPRQPRNRPRPISEADLQAAIDGADGRLRLWLVLAAWCGLRCIEISMLRRACVRHRDTQPHIEVREDATKGGRDGRLVELCPYAAEEVSRYETSHGPLLTGEWMFPGLTRRDSPVTAHNVSHTCCDYLHSLGIPATMHALRHRFGTMAYAASHDLVAVQNLMGHANPATTTGYVKVLAGRGTAIVGALPVPQQEDRRADEVVEIDPVR